jgi:exopolyphosphatase/guanosine-5'-triphosphate,3'-diphosphate pyrophosphatase
MGQQAVKVGVVDIGTNSMRLLITDGTVETGRWVQVTGLGRGVDATGELSADAVAETVAVLESYGKKMSEESVVARAAMATSATRDASNRDAFLDRAESALGVRPEVIGGDREGALAYAGATADLAAGRWVVSDIGGGSTEFVTAGGAKSIDIGSVRLTDRLLADRPPERVDLSRAKEHVAELFESVDVAGDVVGVAGTWTSLAAIDLDLDRYDRDAVHHHSLTLESMRDMCEMLGHMTLTETEAIPSLDPKRAPVILAGALIAQAVLDAIDTDAALVSERDTLDGLAMELLAVT